MPEPVYAPRYRQAVRRRCAWALGLTGLAVSSWLHFVFFPAFHDFAAHADCRSLWGMPGHLAVFYGGMVVPAALMLLFAAAHLPAAVRILRSRQYPPPGCKTFRLIRIRRGLPALLQAWFRIAFLLGCLGVTVYAWTVAEGLAGRYRAAYPDGPVCESETAVPAFR